MPIRVVPQCLKASSLGSIDGRATEEDQAAENHDVEADSRSVRSYDSYTSRTSLDERGESEFCCGLCCFQGCIWGVIAVLYLFVLIPGGLLLVWHGYKHKNNFTLAPGICVLIMAAFGIPVSFFVFRYVKKRRRERIRAYEVEKSKRKINATYENPIADISEDCLPTYNRLAVRS